MENTIKTKNGIITIKYVPKHYNFEMLALDGRDNVNILIVEYSSNSIVLEDENKINNLFREFESQIIQIIKFYIAENIEFYKHFNIDLNMPSSLHTSFEKPIKYDKIFKTELI